MTPAADRPRERGFSLVAAMSGIAIMMIMMAAAVPSWRYVMQNMREEELIFRGNQIAEAIERYQRKNGGAAPTSLEVLVKGKFQGFRVNQIDPAWAASGVAVNDVLRRLNGAPIERPEQALAAFESLRVASELALELSREGQIVSLRYRIEDIASTSSTSAPP